MYDNYPCPDQTWKRMRSSTKRRALVDAGLDTIIQGRVVLLGDFNAHCPGWNVYYGERKDAVELKRLVEDNDLILNNERGKATWSTRKKTTSIIDLTFTTPDMCAVDTWYIDNELSTQFKYEVIVCNLVDSGEGVGSKKTS